MYSYRSSSLWYLKWYNLIWEVLLLAVLFWFVSFLFYGSLEDVKAKIISIDEGNQSVKVMWRDDQAHSDVYGAFRLSALEKDSKYAKVNDKVILIKKTPSVKGLLKKVEKITDVSPTPQTDNIMQVYIYDKDTKEIILDKITNQPVDMYTVKKLDLIFFKKWLR